MVWFWNKNRSILIELFLAKMPLFFFQNKKNNEILNRSNYRCQKKVQFSMQNLYWKANNELYHPPKHRDVLIMIDTLIRTNTLLA